MDSIFCDLVSSVLNILNIVQNKRLIYRALFFS